MDCLEGLKGLQDGSVDCVVTSPPYWGLRDYGVDGQLGLEATPEAYTERIVAIFREVKRVLKDRGTVWLNLGDSYAGNREKATKSATATVGNTVADVCAKFNKVVSGLKPKDIVGIPWRVAFALQADGWYLRSDIIWAKPNPMPESVRDRPTKAHEYIFLLTKSERYYYDQDAIREPHKYADDPRNDGQRHTYADDAKHNQVDPNRQRTKTDCVSFHPKGRNKRTIWQVSTRPFPDAHFAVYPPELITPCIKAGCPVGGVVLDPFMGSGTTAVVARQNGRSYIGYELNKEYCEIAEKRLGAWKGQEVLIK